MVNIGTWNCPDTSQAGMAKPVSGMVTCSDPVIDIRLPTMRPRKNVPSNFIESNDAEGNFRA